MRSVVAGSRVVRAFLVALMWSVWVPAHALDEGLLGVWTGRWHLGMSSGSAILTLRDADSTLEMTNNEEFGTSPVVLTGIELTQGALAFRATGQNGVPLVAKLPLMSDNKGLRGYARYGAVRVLLDVTLSPSR
jgi:hypothetical protein